MSAKTTSLLLLAAIGLAACDNDSSPASVTPTPTPPAQETPTDETPTATVETLTRANAVAAFSLDEDGDEIAAVENLAAAQLAFVAARDNAIAVNALTAELVALAEEFGTDGVPNDRAPEFQALVDEINRLVGVEGAVEQVGPQPANEYADYVRGVAESLATDLGIVTENAQSGVVTAQENLEDAQESFAQNAWPRTEEGETITLADGTVLQTASSAVYTRFDENTTDETVLTPTATVVVAYETDENGRPTSVAFYEAGGIAFEGAPVGTAFVNGSGESYAFMEVGDLDAMPMSGRSNISLDFNNSSGTFGANMSSVNNNDYASVRIASDLMFNRQTGQFMTSTGSVVAMTDEDSFTTTNGLTLDGNLRGLAEAYSGTFQVTGSDINGDGAFIGTATPTEPTSELR